MGALVESTPESRAAVAVAGCGAVTAAGRGLGALAAAVAANDGCLRHDVRFAGGRFQSDVVGAVPPDIWEALRRAGRGPEDDPAFLLADDALDQARRDAAPRLAAADPDRTGLVLSTTKANALGLEAVADGRACSPEARRHASPVRLAEDLAGRHGARGPVECVSMACASGLVALQQAARMILRDEADAVLVAGVDCLSGFVMAGFSCLKSLDPDGCRPFDRDRRGLTPGEAGAALVLARDDRVTDRLGEIRGWGTSNDANHLTGPSRDGSGLALAMRRAMDCAGVGPGEIGYVHAHGTGTPYNDAMESMALRSVFGGACPPWSSSKGILGHTLGAAGLVECLVCLLALRSRVLPGTPRLRVGDPVCPEGLLREPVRRDGVRAVLKTNTGFSGVNGAVVLGE
jgi:3-oxoacyl-[acyl-carrier-protein] synthase II